MPDDIYRRVKVRLWGDEKFMALSAPPPNGQTLWLRLLTGPEVSKMPGVICVGRLGLAEALGWSPEGFDEAFAELEANGLAKADWKARVILVANALKNNPPESPNVLQSWGRQFALVPDCGLKDEFAAQLFSYAKTLGDKWVEAFQVGFGWTPIKTIDPPSPKPSPKPSVKGVEAVPDTPSLNQEQEQEQERDIPPDERAAKKTWLTPYWDVWIEVFQTKPNPGLLAKALEKAHAESSNGELATALRTYLTEHRGKQSRFLDLHKFAGSWRQWLQPEKQAAAAERKFQW